MAHKKGVGSSKNGRESESKRLGVKIFGGQASTYLLIKSFVLLRIQASTSTRTSYLTNCRRTQKVLGTRKLDFKYD